MSKNRWQRDTQKEHFRCFDEVKALLGNRPLVLDREFSYEELMEILYIERILFVIRLNLGDQHKQPRLIDAVSIQVAPETLDKIGNNWRRGHDMIV